MQSVTVKKQKASNQFQYTSMRVLKDTRKKINLELSKVNKKDYGRKNSADELILYALDLISTSDVEALQEQTLSHQDRFDRDYLIYIQSNGQISKDEYLGKRLSGEISNQQNSLKL